MATECSSMCGSSSDMVAEVRREPAELLSQVGSERQKPGPHHTPSILNYPLALGTGQVVLLSAECVGVEPEGDPIVEGWDLQTRGCRAEGRWLPGVLQHTP